ncbi:MAG: DNA-binding protein [Betaproteobacteria bacterium]|nr:MAG: DNA-binding protein [Betaproteobacteria bacterium]
MLQPAVIDGLAFARNAAVVEGRLGKELLPRLAQSGCSDPALHFVLTGAFNERGEPGLKLAIEGSVRMQCQRCLGSLDLQLHLEARLEFASSEAEITAAEDDIERVVAGREMNVAALVEDEVILALPMVPRHEQCQAAAGAEGGGKASAFQALAALKRSSVSEG